MTLKECYDRFGGDLQDVLGRLRTEKLVQKFVLKFVDDGSYKLLLDSMNGKNYEDAFRAAHTIKGMCQNLGFPKLLKSSSDLSEALRNGYTPEADGFFETVKNDYSETVSAIREFKEGLDA